MGVLEDPQVMAFAVYMLLTLLLALTGLVLFIILVRKLRFKKTQLQIPRGKGFYCSWLTPGMLLFAVLCTGYMIVSILSTKINIL